MSREKEIALYERHYDDPRYAMGSKRRAAVQQIVDDLLPRGTLLDVSTGRGETLRFAEHVGHEATGTEVVEGLLGPKVVFAQAHDLPFEDGSFDHVCCFDVLEHLREEDVHACLREMRRVARVSVTASASERPSVFGNVDLHISRRPAAEWESLMADLWGGATRIINAGGSPCWQWKF
jgi:ubiquinone/menaquinone biosynthesis C-methylase UbiE